MNAYDVIGWVYLAIELAILALAVWALIAAATRPAGDFALAQKSKGFWVGVLGASVLIAANGVFYTVALPFSWLLSMASIFAAIYFLGPERQRMGPRRRRGGGPTSTRGGW